MHDNTKGAYETSANYSFACSVDFTRDSVDKIKMTDESYPVDEIDFIDRGIDNKCQTSFTLPDNT